MNEKPTGDSDLLLRDSLTKTYRFTKRMKTQQENDDSKKRIDGLHKKGKIISFRCDNFINDAVNELERIKRNLLRQTSITTVAGKIISKENGARDSNMDSSVTPVLPTQEEIKHSNEERKFEAFLQAYKLTGISLVKCDNGTLLIELLTSYEGVLIVVIAKVLSMYYCELSQL